MIESLLIQRSVVGAEELAEEIADAVEAGMEVRRTNTLAGAIRNVIGSWLNSEETLDLARKAICDPGAFLARRDLVCTEPTTSWSARAVIAALGAVVAGATVEEAADD